MPLSAQRHRLLVQALVAICTVCGLGLVINLWMVLHARRRIHRLASKVPSCQAALVLGARVHPDGQPSMALRDRLEAGLGLWRTGRVGQILVSGDGQAPEGDEAASMARFLSAQGVPAGSIQEDGCGFRTRASMEQARSLGLQTIAVCSQAFHLPRSLWLARRAGLEAWGLTADSPRYQRPFDNGFREFFARQVAFLEEWLPQSQRRGKV